MKCKVEIDMVGVVQGIGFFADDWTETDSGRGMEFRTDEQTEDHGVLTTRRIIPYAQVRMITINELPEDGE